MQSYLNIVKKILAEGVEKTDRTGTGTIAIAGAMFEHNMADGFPLLTTKKMPFKVITAELEFFIKGITDKQWLIDRKCHIWDEWCNPKKVAYAHDEETKKKMVEERDLGAIYGFQWRHFNAPYQNYDSDYSGQGIDQLKKVIETIKTNPNDRRMLVMAWNPCMLDQMALPPCHYGFQITVLNGKLNLLWSQRSVDTMLGLPFNIA
ncbi:MAG: thymidylate synthase, partial [Candidatus Magasanikbacteria bacterium]|nr:thymidylate synthase [Candidatus Magasanikbacteria bacterium]